MGKIWNCMLLAIMLSTNTVYAAGLRYFGQTDGSYQSTVAYGNNPAAGHYVQADDARICYEVYGQGEALVVLQGGLVGAIAEKGELIDKRSPSYQVIAVSTRGHGRSGVGMATPSYERKTQDLRAVLESITRKPVTIIGFGDGAYTGYFFAATYPEKVKRLVAIGAGEWHKGARQFGDHFANFARLDPAYWQQQMSIRPEPERTKAWYQSNLDYCNQLTVGQEALGKIQAPVLLLAGEKDENAPLATVLAAYRMIPNAQLGIIPNAPHSVLQANFPAVWAAVEPFLNDKPGK